MLNQTTTYLFGQIKLVYFALDKYTYVAGQSAHCHTRQDLVTHGGAVMAQGKQRVSLYLFLE
jgi:hypothetical protein